jgi:phosphotransferase system  glucose/maltose/N-acetylglucosamine-specific IIC component
MHYIGFFLGIILGICGVFKIDLVLIKGLNYFGKYVFFGLFHIFLIYIFYLFSKQKGVLKIIGPLIFGLILCLIGVKFV